MESVVELLQQFERTAREAAASDLSDHAWDATQLRGRVIDLLDRGGRALAVVAGSDANPWSSINWTEADPPVALAPALAVAHQRLSAAARRVRSERGVLVERPCALVVPRFHHHSSSRLGGNTAEPVAVLCR